MKHNIKYMLVLILSIMMFGCGGGSDEPAPVVDVPTPDTETPVITLIGDAVITLTVGDTYNEQGATVTDNVDTAITAVISGAVDTNTVGTYTITYTATDAANNQSTATRTVNVEAQPDTEAPVITLIGDAVITLTVGGTYNEQGATVTDNVDTALTAVISGAVDTNTVGTYTITYTATDAANNQSTASRTVNVEAQVTASTNAYIFDSENEQTFNIEFWGDDWDSGTVFTDQPSDNTYARALEITKGTGWGTVIAWGNEPENAVDISTYTHARFKIKTDTFTGVSVIVQSATESESQITYDFSSGTVLENGWTEMEVRLPGFSDMTWFTLNFLGNAGTTVLLADVYFTTLELDPVTGPPTAAPAPPALADNEAVVLYSDSLTQDSFVGLWNANYFEAPVYSTGDVNGDNFAKYTITAGGTNGGVTGLEFGFENGVLDASMHTTWNMDMYIEPGITEVRLQLVSRDGGAQRIITNPTTGEWLSLELPYNELTDNDGAGFDVLNSSLLQLIVIQLYGPQGTSVYVDNIYFSGVSTSYDMTVNVVDDNNAALANAEVKVGDTTVNTDVNGDAVVTVPEGNYKVFAQAEGFGASQANQEIAGGDATLSMSVAPLNAGPSEAAPVPTADNNDVFVLYSDTLTVDKSISFWNDDFFKAPVYSEISIGGNNTAKFQIIPGGEDGGITGIQYGVQGGTPDVSSYTGLRLDVFVTSGVTGTEIQLVPLYGGGVGFSGKRVLPTGQWVSLVLPFSEFAGEFDPANIAQLGLKLWGSTSDSVYIDNIYYY